VSVSAKALNSAGFPITFSWSSLSRRERHPNHQTETFAPGSRHKSTNRLTSPSAVYAAKL
jgi:hypothetical protein